MGSSLIEAPALKMHQVICNVNYEIISQRFKDGYILLCVTP